MAEFKLGRIRFVWKGDWGSTTQYYKDDVVAFGGRIYICVLGHTSDSEFFTDLNVVPTKWNLVSDGQTWRGDWEPQVGYNINDIVRYGATLYICQTNHTSAIDSTQGIEADLANWQIFAQSIQWVGNWAASTQYKVKDIVKYGGTTYVCNTPHTSAATDALGLEADQSKWDIFNQGFDYKSSWTSGVRYKLNDVVRFGANLYIAVMHHTSAADFATDSANWAKFVDGFQFEDEWDAYRLYQEGDIVRYGGNQYVSITTHTGEFPSTSFANWKLFSEGLRFMGDWNEDSSNFEYRIGDVVRLGGYTYRCVLDHQNQQPPNATYWSRLNSGFDWRGEWLDDQEYFEGDVVRYGNNSYVCTQGHISEGDDFSSLGGAAGSRPDLADSGQYWSIIAVGTEESVLTTVGDLVYYSGNAPTRLPIGKNGQILQVSADGLPEWNYFALTDDVYYVAENGTDLPAPEYGKSFDRPWKTIRYATEQVEKGARNPAARLLLEKNRIFIQREVSEWIEDQVANDTAPFTTSFVFDTVKCQRDIGFVFDRIVHDLTHGGNLKTRAAAQTFVNALAEGPFSTAAENNGTGTYNNLSIEGEESVAAYNYMLSLIEKVLNNEPPTVNYQTTRGDNSTAIVSQYIDETVLVEPTAFAKITELMEIITDALTVQNSSVIPDRVVPQTLIQIATGVYSETLPIIVPAYCAVKGDELRSTIVEPSTGTVDITDSYYTVETFDRFKSVASDVILGSSVTPTSGNTETQSQAWPFAESAESDKVTRLVDAMKHQVDFKLKTMNLADLTDPTGYNDSYLIGYGDARKNVIANKKFVQEEAVAYMMAEYPTLKYSKTLTRRDAVYIIDAIIYDLTYGGNSQSVVAGLAYYDGDDNSQPQISASIKTATINTVNFIKTTLVNVATATEITSPRQTTIPQFRGIPGSVAAGALITNNIEDIVEIIDTGPAAVGTTVTLTEPTLADGVNTTTALISAYSDLNSAVATIQEATIDYINSTYGSFTYNSAYCRRDSGFLVDAGYYDAAFGSNFWAVQNGISYYRPQASKVLAEQKTQEIGSINFIKEQAALALAGDATAVSRANATYDEIVDILENGIANADAIVYTDAGSPSSNATKARQNLVANRQVIIDEGIAWINSNYPSLTYDETLCRRDIGYTVDALAYDSQYGGNLATRNVMRSLFNQITNASVAYPTTDERTAGAAFYTQLGVICGNIVTATATYTGQDTSAGSAGATYDTLMDTLCGYVSTAITNNDNDLDTVVAASAPVITWASAGIQSAVTNLASEKNTIVADTLQFITNTYSSLVYDHAKCSRDVATILKAVGYDFQLNTNYRTLKAGHAYLRPTATEVYTLNQKTATLGALEYVRSLAVQNVNSDATAIARTNTLFETLDAIIFGGSNDGSVCQTEIQNVYSAIHQLDMNRDFIKAEMTAYIADTFSDTVTQVQNSNNSITISDTSWLKRNTAIRFFGDDVAGGLSEGVTYYVYDVLNSTTFTVASTRNATSALTLTDSSNTFEVRMFYSVALCERDVDTYIDALIYDLKYPGNYKSRYVARYYANAVTGSQEEDFYYLRDATGVRDQTMRGLNGDLNPPNEYGTSRPTAGSYCSLDPGWGPDDFTTWIITRSPYIQGVTTFGYAAIGQKIDGALHNGGNDSMVSNDFTQVISDGIGAWITNNGRAELVSVFTYYSHIGYLAEQGGRIRATNGNNSYGDFGSVAEGVDPDETPISAVVDNRSQYKATVANVFTDNVQLLAFEFSHAGNDYTEAAFDIFGSGSNEEIFADEFRDDAMFEARVVPLNDSSGTAGGDGYTVVSNVAQSGGASSIFLAATDGNLSTAYPGMKIYITGGAGIGNYAIIDTYNAGSKEATVLKEAHKVFSGSFVTSSKYRIDYIGTTDFTAIGASENAIGVIFTATGAGSGSGFATLMEPGWDHVVPGTTIVNPNSSSTYLIEPRVEFSSPLNTTASASIASNSYSALGFVKTSAQYTGISASGGTGSGATFDVTRNGSRYYLTVNAGGTGYTRLDELTISGALLGGTSPTNDVTITLTTVNSVTGAAVDFDFSGYGRNGLFLALPTSGTTAAVSFDGNTWTTETLPTPGSGAWSNFASGLVDDGSSTFKASAVVAVCAGSSNVAYSSDADTWSTSTLPVGLNTASQTDVAYGNVNTDDNRFVVVSEADRDVAYSLNGGATWTLVTDALPSVGYTAVTYGKGLFVAVKSGSTEAATSPDGVTWTERTLPASSTWTDVVWGNGKFVAITNSIQAAYSLDGITWVSTTLPGTSQQYRKIAYGQGVFVATRNDNVLAYSEHGLEWNTLTVAAEAAGYNAAAHGNPNKTGKFVTIGSSTPTTTVAVSSIGSKARGRVSVASEKIFEIRITEPGSGYASAPGFNIFDPNNLIDVDLTTRLGKGAVANPTFINRGTGFVSASAEINSAESDGFADFFQDGAFVAVKWLTERPVSGSNVEFSSLPGRTFKLVTSISFTGTNPGSYKVFLQLNPSLEIEEALPEGDDVEMRIRFSQVRLTGHDFLDIGTGNQTKTNYPGTPTVAPDQTKETQESNGGRVFFTATDQDGNFRVGTLFSIEQATGVATLDAEAFNIAGLQELTLGEVTLGGNSASITEFSTDPFFTANSDTIVPTQRAIKAYIEAQIGGGGASLVVNSVTAGDIFLGTNQITTVSGELINIRANVVFTGSVLGLPLAYNYFLR